MVVGVAVASVRTALASFHCNMKDLIYVLLLYLLIDSICKRNVKMWTENDLISPKVQTVEEGMAIFIYCFTRYTTPTWTHNGIRLHNPSKVVAINRARVVHSGLYTCDGLDTNKVLISVTSRVYISPKYQRGSIYPNVNNVELGSNTFFKCDSPANVTWNFVGALVLPSNAHPDHDTLVIVNAAFSNGGFYECACFNSSYKFFSAKAELRVFDSTRIQPNDTEVYMYKSIKLSCEKSIIAAHWVFNDSELPCGVAYNVSNGDLKIPRAVRKHHQGYYECAGLGKFEGLFLARAFLKVLVRRKGQLLPPDQKVKKGKEAKFTCSSFDTVTWRHNGNTELPSNTKVSRKKEKSADVYTYILKIKSAKFYNSGIYACEGMLIGREVEYFYDLSNLQVEVRCKRPKIKKGKAILGEVGRGQPIVVALYQCQVGYTLEGSSARHCLPSGQWSGESPTCKYLQTSGGMTVCSHGHYFLELVLFFSFLTGNSFHA